MFAPEVMRALRKNKTLRYGVPMLLLIVGGSFGLREFSQIRYDAVKIKKDTYNWIRELNNQNRAHYTIRKKEIAIGHGGDRDVKAHMKTESHRSRMRQIDPELEKKLKENKVSLESEYEKIKDSTFDDWKNIRGPRPWEDTDLLQGRNPEILKTKTT
nr:cytochrome c oxidase assembly protein COX16 homolog, mitochondrial isoform X2 [Microcebus murinus]